MTEGTCRTIKMNKNLNEPSGICVCNDSIVIADTNNHQIVTIPTVELFSEVSNYFFFLNLFDKQF